MVKEQERRKHEAARQAHADKVAAEAAARQEVEAEVQRLEALELEMMDTLRDREEEYAEVRFA